MLSIWKQLPLTYEYENFNLKNTKSLINSNYSFIDSNEKITKIELDSIDKSSFLINRFIKLRYQNRKCHWNKCSFCIQTIESTQSKYYSLDGDLNLLSEIIKKLQPEFIYFSDENLNKADLIEISDFLMERNINWACRSSFDNKWKQKSFLNKLFNSGLIEILFGIETFSTDLLKHMNKQQKDIEYIQQINILKKLLNTGIGVHLSMIFHHPGESNEDIELTIKTLNELLEYSDLVSYTLNTFKLFPESRIGKNPSDYGIKITNRFSDGSLDWKYIDRHKKKSEASRDLFNRVDIKKFQEIEGDEMRRNVAFLYNNTFIGLLDKSCRVNLKK